MTVYDPYGAVLDASPGSASSSSALSSRPSTSSSHGSVVQQGEKSPKPSPSLQHASQSKLHECPPPPYSPTFRQHPSLRTTLFEPASFDDGAVVRPLEDQTLGSITPPAPSSPTSTYSSILVDPNAPPISPIRRSVTFSTADHVEHTHKHDSGDNGDDEKTTAVHHSRPSSRSHSIERGASYVKRVANSAASVAAAPTPNM